MPMADLPIYQQEPVLQVRDLQVEFRTEAGTFRAVDGITYAVYPGETLGVVGESGSGKSVSHLGLLGLLPRPPARIVGGTAEFQGRDLLQLSDRELQDVRGRHMSMVFQDPMTSLNPFLTIGKQLTEITVRHLGHTESQARRHAIEMLERVGIHPAGRRFHDYPHQFSGGMRQRVLVAMALACSPRLLIADEPTTALDVSIQAQILQLLQDLAHQQGTAVILITHNLGIVARYCQRVLVMYAGRIVEQADVSSLFARPRHPYTRGLLASIPSLEQVQPRLRAITGQPPDLARLPTGCPFSPRCSHVIPQCRAECPPLESWSANRQAACWVDLATIETKEGA